MAESEDPLLGFEGRLQRVISDLEDALWGISDEDIRVELSSKGYTDLNEAGFCSFKDQLKKAALHKAVETNTHVLRFWFAIFKYVLRWQPVSQVATQQQKPLIKLSWGQNEDSLRKP